VLDAIKSDKRIFTHTVQQAVEEVQNVLQAIQAAASVLPGSSRRSSRGSSRGSSKQSPRAQPDMADVDLQLFTLLQQVRCC
jgi:hypothetical protein